MGSEEGGIKRADMQVSHGNMIRALSPGLGATIGQPQFTILPPSSTCKPAPSSPVRR